MHKSAHPFFPPLFPLLHVVVRKLVSPKDDFDKVAAN